MFRRALVLTVALFVVAPVWAQSLCPLNGVSVNKLACLIPQIYGPYGLGSGNGAPLLANGHQAHFEGDFLTAFTPINTAIGIQASQLPLASPSSGISFVFDPALKTFAPSVDTSLGPILGDRADTIGRHKAYIAFSYQHFSFDSIDGISTSAIPAIFKHAPFPLPSFACPNQTGLTGDYAGNPCFVRDFIGSVNNLNLSENQYALYATFGITSRLDVSVAIPFLTVNLRVANVSTVTSNSVAPTNINFPGNVFHQFDPANVPSCGSQSPCMQATFGDSNSASGIGDVVFRGKYQVYKGEHLGFGLGLDVRTPTGDPGNYLGSGAVGVRPFGVISYRARVSPHAEIGYEVNGKSILAGDFVGVTANTKGSLPDRLTYFVGADVGITKRFSAAFDLIGARLFGAPQIFSNPFTDLGKCSDLNCTVLTPGTTHPDVAVRTTDYNQNNASFGIKFRPIGNLVITGNALVRLDDGGLKANVAPLIGISYTF